MSFRNILLLFACMYAWAYMFPSPLDQIPGLDQLFQFYASGLEVITVWFGQTVLGLSELKKIEMTGSGDTTFDYVLIPVKLIMALLLTLGSMWWLLRDEKRFDTFLFWTRTGVRWYVGLFMVIYGIAKLVEGGQFGPPDLSDLNQRYGDFSPMGLLWRFMGFSHTYAAFTGFAEVLAGLLLLFRRTTTLGALLSVGVMTHVFMLNMCFDVPVKLFSFHLILLSAGLLFPNLRQLWRFFILNKPAALVAEPDRLNKRWMVIARHSLRALLVGGMFFSVLYFSFSADTPKDDTAFRGIYQVETFDHPALQRPFADTLTWNRAVIERNQFILTTEDNKLRYYRFSTDSLNTTMTVASYRDSTQVFTFATVRDSNQLKIVGLWKGDTLRASLRRLDDSKMLLTSRGFRWVNEYPFNR
jgi:hypothetical protein